MKQRNLPNTIHALGCLLGLTILSWGCGDPPGAKEHPWDKLHFPTHLTVSPDGNHLHIINSNFNLRYQSGAVLTVDLDTHQFVEDGYLPLPSFTGPTVLHQDEDGNFSSYWPDREDGKLLWADYMREGENWFTCEQDSYTGRCSEEYEVFNGTLDGNLARMERDPYAIGVVKSIDGGPSHLLTGGLLDPKVTLWELTGGGQPIFKDQITLANGLSGVAVHPVTGTPYMTAQYAQNVYAIDIDSEGEDGASIGGVAAIALPNETRIGSPIFGQNITFDTLGALAFVPYRYPSSVAVLDVSPDETGNPNNLLLGFTEAGASPTDVEVVELKKGEEILYVSSASRGQVYGYSLPDLQLIATIEVGRGAGDMVSVIESDSGRSRLYVSLFEEAGVAVVDITPDSPWYHQLIATIR